MLFLYFFLKVGIAIVYHVGVESEPKNGENNVVMKKALILLADGFEETEALTTHDILIRSHAIKPTLVSMMESLMVTTSMGLKVIADHMFAEIDPNDYDFVILPGGKVGVDNLSADPRVIALLKKYHDEGKHHHAICAAPSILCKLGYLDDKSFTCFPGFQSGKGTYLNKGVVVDGDQVTGRSMGYTIEFAEEIVKLEAGQEALDSLYFGTRGKEKE